MALLGPACALDRTSARTTPLPPPESSTQKKKSTCIISLLVSSLLPASPPLHLPPLWCHLPRCLLTLTGSRSGDATLALTPTSTTAHRPAMGGRVSPEPRDRGGPATPYHPRLYSPSSPPPPTCSHGDNRRTLPIAPLACLGPAASTAIRAPKLPANVPTAWPALVP